MFVNDPDYIKVEHGVKKGSLYMSYASIYEDVRTACDWMHRVGRSINFSSISFNYLFFI